MSSLSNEPNISLILINEWACIKYGWNVSGFRNFRSSSFKLFFSLDNGMHFSQYFFLTKLYVFLTLTLHYTTVEEVIVINPSEMCEVSAFVSLLLLSSPQPHPVEQIVLFSSSCCTLAQLPFSVTALLKEISCDDCTHNVMIA